MYEGKGKLNRVVRGAYVHRLRQLGWLEDPQIKLKATQMVAGGSWS